MQVRFVLETCLYVDDLPAAEEFYTRVLGLEVLTRQEERHVFFRCGGQMLLLFNPAHTDHGDDEIPHHGARGSGHVAFGVEADELPAWRAWFAAEGVPIESEVEWPNGALSVYFRDPADNCLELATPSLWGLKMPPE